MANYETYKILPANVCKISVEEVLSPSTFWITDVPDSEHRLQVKSFENYLCTRFQNHQRINFLPELGDIVAVVSPKSSQWCRGIIQGRINYIHEDKYQVFFVDYGYKDLVSMSSMAGLSNRMKVYPFQAYQLILYGIVPPERNDDQWAGTDSDVLWDPDALDFVQKMISSSAGDVYLKPHYKNGNRIIGEIFLKASNNEYVDLSYLLHWMKLAAFNDDKFWEMNPEASKHLESMWSQFSEDDFDVFIEDNDDSTESDCATCCIKDVLLGTPEVRDILASRGSSQVTHSSLFSAGRGIRTGHRVTRPGVKNNISSARSDTAYSSSLDSEDEDYVESKQRVLAVQLPPASNKSFVSENKININKSPTQLRNITGINTSPTQSKTMTGIKKSPIQENLASTKKSPPHQENTISLTSKEVCGKAQINALFSLLSNTKKQNVQSVSEPVSKSVIDIPTRSVVDMPNESVVDTLIRSEVDTHNDEIVVADSALNTETHIAHSPLKNANCENSPSSLVNSNMSPETCPSITKPVEIIKKKERGEVFYHNLVLVSAANLVSEVNFNANIAEACKKLEIVTPMFIQSSLWPALCRGLSAIIVASSGSGKTLAYLLPVISHCASKDRLVTKKPSSGPLALILCVDSGRAQDVYNMCCNIIKLGKIDSVRVEIILGGGKEVEKMAALINGPEIIITMPSVYLKFFQASQYITNFKRLGYLVLEDADLLLERFPQQTVYFLDKSKKMKSNDEWTGIQYISVSEKWCSNIEYIREKFPQNSVVCIKSSLETAICVKIKPVLHVVETNKKDGKLLEILQNQEFKLKTVIVCKDAYEVKHLQDVLQLNNFDVMSIHESNNSLLRDEILSRWKDLSLRMILCSDDVVLELDIKDARFLVHYSLPNDSKTQFENRFYCLRNMYKLQNNVSTCKDNHKVSKTSSSYCAIHILVDTQNSQQFPVLMEVMKRLGCDIPDSAKRAVANVLKHREKQKVSIPLCDDLKSFGKCWYRSKCQKRHVILPDVDLPNVIPSSGKVKVRVLSVKNAATFIVRLLEHIDLNEKSTTIPNDYDNIVSQLWSFFSVPHNRCSITTPKVGDICCLEIAADYYRVKIIEIRNEDKLKILKVLLLDEGVTKECKESALLTLPNKLQEYVPQAVEVLLCRIAPCEGDTCWSDTATEAMMNWITEGLCEENDEAAEKYIIGKIVLCLGSTLWLDPFEYRQFVTNIKTDVLLLTPRKLLIENRYAVDNPEHMDHLYRLCDDAGIARSTVQQYVKKEPLHIEVVKTVKKPQWAHLPKDKLRRVTIDSVINPNAFFVSQFDFSDSLQDLENDLNKFLKSEKNKLKNIEVGTVCASLFPEDNRWYRGCIKEIVSEAEVDVFFVDHGDYAFVANNELAELPEPFVSRLPFQTIECSLMGVKPLNSSWDKQATDWLSQWQDLSLEKYVYAKVFSHEEPCHTAGHKYTVVLVTVYPHMKDEYFPVSDELIDKGFAVKIEDYDDIMNSLYPEVQEVTQKLDEEIDDIETIDTEEIVEDAETINAEEIQVSNESVMNGDVFNDDVSSDGSEADVYFDDSFMDVLKSGAAFLFMHGINGEEAVHKFQDKLKNNKNGFFVSKSVMQTEIKNSIADKCAVASSNDDLSTDSMNSKCPVVSMPALQSVIKTPQSLWYQDEYSVHIKVMLPNITECNFKCNANELLFSTEVDDNMYYVRFVLFGKIDGKEATYCTQGFYVHITLPKLQEGVQWPQLTRPMTSSLKVSLDTDHIRDEIEGDCAFSCASKHFTIKKVTDSEGQGLYPPEGYDFINELFPEEEEEEEEEENKYVVEEVFHDVFDPLN